MKLLMGVFSFSYLLPLKWIKSYKMEQFWWVFVIGSSGCSLVVPPYIVFSRLTICSFLPSLVFFYEFEWNKKNATIWGLPWWVLLGFLWLFLFHIGIFVKCEGTFVLSRFLGFPLQWASGTSLFFFFGCTIDVKLNVCFSFSCFLNWSD